MSEDQVLQLYFIVSGSLSLISAIVFGYLRQENAKEWDRLLGPIPIAVLLVGIFWPLAAIAAIIYATTMAPSLIGKGVSVYRQKKKTKKDNEETLRKEKIQQLEEEINRMKLDALKKEMS